MILIASSLIMAAASGTPCPSDPEGTMAKAAEAVTAAYDAADGKALEAARQPLEEGLGCATRVLAQPELLAVHRAYALVAFYAGDDQGVIRSLASLRALDPKAELDPDRWPARHPIWSLWASAAQVSSEEVALERTPPGGWAVEGRQATSLPLERASVVQALGERGDPLATSYVRHPTQLPLTDWTKLSPTDRLRRRKRVRLAGSALAGGLLVGSALGWQHARSAEKAAFTAPYEDVRRLEGRVRTGYTLAMALAGSSAALGAATWTIRW